VLFRSNNFQVEVTAPGGYSATLYHIGSTSADSDANGSPVSVTLPFNNSQNLTIDFGFFIPNPHIQITKSSGTFTEFAQVSFTLVATNDGNTPLTNAHITDQLPSNGGLQWQSYTTTKGSCTISGANFLDCQLGSLAPAEAVTITVSSTNPTPANACTLQPNPAANVTTSEGPHATAAGQLSCTPPPTPCPAGYFSSTIDIVTGDLKIVYDQFPAPNDNSYGVNSVGWMSRGHKFSDLVGSDHADSKLSIRAAS